MGGSRNLKNFFIETRSDGQRDFFQHDDRGYSGNGNRNSHNRKNQIYSSRNKYSKRDFGGKSRRKRMGFQDGDVQMKDENPNRHQQYYDATRGSKKSFKKKKTHHSSWNKIIMKKAAAYSHEEIIETIRRYVQDDFIPIKMESEGQDCVFYLENNFGVAKAIANLSSRLVLGINERIKIALANQAPVYRTLTLEQKKIVEFLLSERYSLEMKRLDLRNFHNDKTLIREKIYMPLFTFNAVYDVMSIITTKCLQVEEIDLSENGLSSTNSFSDLKSLPNLKRLQLGKNKMHNLDSLENLKGLPIIELTLEGNPLCNNFKDPEKYIGGVRDIFSKVVRLDGNDLPPHIGFAVEDDTKLPLIKPSFFHSDEVKSVVVKFLEQYFQIFDLEDRSPLKDAYTTDAFFSLSSHFPEKASLTRFTAWEKESRNLKKVSNPDKRHNLLYRGREGVISLISRLPKVIHDVNSFIIDIPLVQPTLVHAVLTGVFKQVMDKNQQHRNFMKSMVIVPVGNGFCIANEQLYINNASVEQVQKAFKSPPPVSPPISGSVQNVSLPQLSPEKMDLVKHFMVNSKMQPEYCVMCLETNNWDFAKAAEMFLALQKENKLPPHYFQDP